MIDIDDYKKLYNFVKKVALGFCLNQTDEDALKMLVSYEDEAQELYDYVNGIRPSIILKVSDE